MQQQTPSVLTKDSDIEVSSQEDDRKKLRNPCVRFLCDNLFMLLTLVGVAVGFGVGFGAKRLPDLSIAETWIKMPGDLYIRLLQLAILPLISSNLIIGVLFVSIVFGLAARVAGDRSKPFLDFFSSVADVVLVLIRWFLVLTPIGVCFMIAGAIMPVDDIQGTFAGLGFFILCVVVGCVINSIVTFLLFLVFTRRNPFKFFRYCVKAWIVAFATTSPIVSIPEMYQGCDDYGVDKDISRFTCPLVTTLKADGPAIFISSAAMFVTQFTLGSAPAGTAVVIWLLTSASVFAIPHIPSASIVITITILSSLGVSTQAASLLYAVDWFL
ncbi:unnamed protein product [Schistocephalus solidus]|uniref:Amino acid transporter n=1 Tax=Schistocephalus solidus TaxID=70667 RepID=A0A183SGY3_SCHSO|nr:unnamed protein product [Schistocephalus solidus]